MDAIKLLKTDHRNVEALFKRFEKAGDKAYAEKRRIVQAIIKELSIHAVIEEELLYPAARARATNEKLDELVLEALEEHHIAKWTLNELEKMSPEDERFDAKVSVLMENIRHHVEEEEEELFPKLQRVMVREELEALGEALAKAKRTAPTHPHPMAPDTPPGNVISGILAKILDTGRDLARDMGRRATGAGRARAKTVRLRPAAAKRSRAKR